MEGLWIRNGVNPSRWFGVGLSCGCHRVDEVDPSRWMESIYRVDAIVWMLWSRSEPMVCRGCDTMVAIVWMLSSDTLYEMDAIARML